MEAKELQRKHANQVEGLDLRIHTLTQKVRFILEVAEIVAAEEQPVAGETYLVLTQSLATVVHHGEGILHQDRLVNLLILC